MQALQPHVTVLPDEATPVNLNTASAEVIAAMIPDAQLSAVKTFVAQRDRLPLTTLSSANSRMGLDTTIQLNRAAALGQYALFLGQRRDQVRSRRVPDRDAAPPRQFRGPWSDPGRMATPNLKLKRHQAVVWLPPRSAGERAFGSEALLLAHVGGEPVPTIRRASLDSLQGVKQVWLVADARDVSLLEVTRCRRCRAPGCARRCRTWWRSSCCRTSPSAWWCRVRRRREGKRLVGVIDKDWVEFVVGAFARRQMRVEALWPAQLALPTASRRMVAGLLPRRACAAHRARERPRLERRRGSCLSGGSDGRDPGGGRGHCRRAAAS